MREKPITTKDLEDYLLTQPVDSRSYELARFLEYLVRNNVGSGKENDAESLYTEAQIHEIVNRVTDILYGQTLTEQIIRNCIRDYLREKN